MCKDLYQIGAFMSFCVLQERFHARICLIWKCCNYTNAKLIKPPAKTEWLFFFSFRHLLQQFNIKVLHFWLVLLNRFSFGLQTLEYISEKTNVAFLIKIERAGVRREHIFLKVACSSVTCACTFILASVRNISAVCSLEPGSSAVFLPPDEGIRRLFSYKPRCL